MWLNTHCLLDHSARKDDDNSHDDDDSSDDENTAPFNPVTVTTFMDWGENMDEEKDDDGKSKGISSEASAWVKDMLKSFPDWSRFFLHAQIALGRVDPMGVYDDGEPEIAKLAGAVNELCDIDYSTLGGYSAEHEERLKMIADSKTRCLKAKATPFCRLVVDVVRRSIAAVDERRRRGVVVVAGSVEGGAGGGGDEN